MAKPQNITIGYLVVGFLYPGKDDHKILETENPYTKAYQLFEKHCSKDEYKYYCIGLVRHGYISGNKDNRKNGHDYTTEEKRYK